MWYRLGELTFAARFGYAQIVAMILVKVGEIMLKMYDAHKIMYRGFASNGYARKDMLDYIEECQDLVDMAKVEKNDSLKSFLHG